MRGRWTILGVVLTGAVAAVLLVSGEEDPAQHRLDKALSGHRRKESEYKDDAMVVRPSAADALGKISPAANESTPVLIAALKGKDKEVRWLAAFALGEIGPAAKEAVPALTATLKDDEAVVRREAASALGQIGSAAKEAIPALIAALKDENRWVRRWAALALGEIGPAANEAVPALEAAARDGVSAAELALKKIRDDG